MQTGALKKRGSDLSSGKKCFDLRDRK